MEILQLTGLTVSTLVELTVSLLLAIVFLATAVVWIGFVLDGNIKFKPFAIYVLVTAGVLMLAITFKLFIIFAAVIIVAAAALAMLIGIGVCYITNRALLH